MASLRGASDLWVATDSESATGTSAEVQVGVAPNVAVFVKNTAGTQKTFKVQAAAPNPGAGANPIDSSLSWYIVQRWNGTAWADMVLTVPATTGAVCVDLSPFAPEVIRLESVEGFAAGEVTARVVSVGPN